MTLLRVFRAFPLALMLLLLLIVVPSCRPASEPMEGSAPSGDTAEGDTGGGSSGMRPDWALAIHGGAGVIPKDMEVSAKQEYVDALTAALTLGKEALDRGDSALDTVEKILRTLEDDPKFNAGKGAVYTHEGTHELDAAIMDGRTLNCGSVAALKTIKNPISLARLVMERSPHVFLIGEGAEAFASEMGVERVTQQYFDTARRKDQLDRMLEQEAAEGDKHGTVGAVALDRAGNLAAATSTGGLTDKRFGRVGDVPVIGAGTYANNRTCAVSGTGIGEQFIRHTVARSISAAMDPGGMPLEEAARSVIDGLEPGDGGVIAVGHDGSIALVFNSPGMFRGTADSRGRFEIGIWESMERASPP